MILFLIPYSFAIKTLCDKQFLATKYTTTSHLVLSPDTPAQKCLCLSGYMGISRAGSNVVGLIMAVTFSLLLIIPLLVQL